MSSQPFTSGVLGVDLSARFAQSSALVGSPAGGSITSICELAVPDFNIIPVTTGVILEGFAAFTVGTSGVSALLQIRQTGISGAVVATTGAVTVVGGDLHALSVQGIDTGPLAAGVWILALTIGSGAAESTVSSTQLLATVV